MIGNRRAGGEIVVARVMDDHADVSAATAQRALRRARIQLQTQAARGRNMSAP